MNRLKKYWREKMKKKTVEENAEESSQEVLDEENKTKKIIQ